MTGTDSDWPEVALGDICDFKYGRSLPAGERIPGTFPVFGSNGQVGTHIDHISNGPTIVIGRKGSFGEVNYSELSCWPIDTTYYIDSSATEADLKWLSYRLKGLGLTELNRAAAIPGMNRQDAYEKRLRLPPLSEQRRIAMTLDRVLQLRAKRSADMETVGELAESVFVEMFGNAGRDEGMDLRGCLTFVTSGGRGWAKYYSESGSRFIRSLDVRMNHIDDTSAVYVAPPDNAEARRTHVRAGDVLLTITGSLIGRVAPVPAELEGSYISQHVAILRTDRSKLLPEFLAYFLSLPTQGQAQIAASQYGQTKPGLNFEQIRNFKIPSVGVDRQEAFIARLETAQNLRTLLGTSLAELDELFASLQHNAFVGTLWANQASHRQDTLVW